MTIPSTTAPRRYPGRLFLFLGLAFTVLGVAAYAVQISRQRLFAPWYLPASATLGLVLLLISLGKTRTVWRWLSLLLVVLLAGAEWFLLLGFRLPPYTGPITAGKPFPAFATLRADGAPFTQRDVEGDQNNVLVFFRGRW